MANLKSSTRDEESSMTDAVQEKVISAPELLDEAKGIENSRDVELHRRIFVKELAGRYGQVYKQIFEGPRVIHTKTAKKWSATPQLFQKSVMTPQDFSSSQLFHCGLKILAPGGKSNNHGHMNTAIFYILEGNGYDIHDGVKLPYKAGDICIVEPGCVHQHFNADPDNPLKCLMIKPKPLYLFSNLGFQRFVEKTPTESVEGWEGWMPDEVIEQGFTFGDDD